MKNPFLYYLSVPISSLILCSCNPKKQNNDKPGGISSDIVNITASASAKDSVNGKMPKISFADTAFDFGEMKEGDKVSHSYTFINKGNGDLVITGAKSTCGCTIPTVPQDVIHPGQSDKIDVSFNSENKQGKILKYITVTTNCYPNTSYLTFTANITPTNK